MVDRPRLVAPAIAALALLAGGCGSSGGSKTHAATTTPNAAASTPKAAPATPKAGQPGPRTITIPSPPPTGKPADPAAVKVIEDWSSALRRGDVAGAARLFARPSTMINGVGANGVVQVQPIHTSTQALAANASLPCGAKFLSADQRGKYVNALFRLTGRRGLGGTSCGGVPGQTARTNFVIVHGLIVSWVRAPDDPGDNGGPSTPTPAPQSPQPSPGGVVPVA